jgi:hypothetical protein
MKTHDSHLVSRNTVQYGTAPVDGLNIAYREAGDPGNPKLVLHCMAFRLRPTNIAISFLHWPTASTSFRQTTPRLR